MSFPSSISIEVMHGLIFHVAIIIVVNLCRFGFTTVDATSQMVKVEMRSARGRAVTEHFTAPSHQGGVRGDTAAALEAKRAKRTLAQAQRVAGAGLANTDGLAVEQSLASSTVVVMKTSQQAQHAVQMLGARGVDIEKTTSPLYPVAMKKKKDSHAL
jgi:hypothetical protein